MKSYCHYITETLWEAAKTFFLVDGSRRKRVEGLGGSATTIKAKTMRFFLKECIIIFVILAAGPTRPLPPPPPTLKPLYFEKSPN